MKEVWNKMHIKIYWKLSSEVVWLDQKMKMYWASDLIRGKGRKKLECKIFSE